MSSQSVMDLIESEAIELVAVEPDRGIVHVPQAQIGDGLAGPPNDQPLQIFRDDRPIATDELGMGHLGKVARHRAGRTFPLNYTWGAWFDPGNYDHPPEQGRLAPSPLDPGQSPSAHPGILAPEVIRNPRTIFYTATPDVGWEGY